MPAERVGRLTTKSTFAALQRSRRRGRCGPVQAVYAPAPTASPGVASPDTATSPDAIAEMVTTANAGNAGRAAVADRHATDAFPQAGGRVQVGYAVGKRCGPAVVRNTLRRRMREVARATAPSLPSGSYLLRLSPEAGRRERARFREDVATALRRAAGADAGRPAPQPGRQQQSRSPV